MRVFRVIAYLAIFGLIWIMGTLLWSLLSPGASRMDAYATARIRKLCGYQANCKVKAGELFAGDWDTVFVFGSGVTQHEIDALLGRGFVRAPDTERIIVLRKNGKILRVERESDYFEKPVNGQVEFEDEDHREQRTVGYRRDQWLRVTPFPIQPSGRFYVLTTTDDR